MLMLGCFRSRSRLSAYADGALGARAAARAGRHVALCPACRKIVSDQQRLRALLRQGSPVDGPPPDWAGFWPAVERRLREEAPGLPTVRDPWWLPVWKPVWGHPRVAFAGAATGLLVLALTLQPIGPTRPPAVDASPIVVQDATTADPDASVMIYTGSGADDVTVIWLLASGAPDAS